MINTERLERIKGFKWLNVVAKSIIPAILLFLIQWHWTLNDRIARLEEKTKQDRAQWETIQQVYDSNMEQEVRLRVSEKIQDWSIMAGILNHTDSKSTSMNNTNLDVQEIRKKVKDSKDKPAQKGVDRFIQQRMAK